MPPINPIEAELKRDTTSWTAQFYFDNYNDGRFTSVSQVPRFMYTCLADLVSGSGSLNNLVYSEIGTAAKQARLGITILGTDYCEDYMGDFLEDDTIGGERQVFQILVNNVFTSTDYFLIRDIGLRIRYILDFRNRGLYTNQFMLVNSPDVLDISPASDNTLNWQTYMKVKHDDSRYLSAKEQLHTFSSYYQRMF